MNQWPPRHTRRRETRNIDSIERERERETAPTSSTRNGILTWTQTTLGNNWPLTLKPPSIAMPRMGFDFLILTRSVRRTNKLGFLAAVVVVLAAEWSFAECPPP